MSAAAEPGSSRVPATEEARRRSAAIEQQVRFAGREELADRVAAARAALDDPRPATVVVVGEPKKGKSALVNALLGRPGLSPVGTTTSTYVVFTHSEDEGARVHRADGETEDVALAVLGSRAAGGATGVAMIEARVDAPLLAAGLALVDTPGVGGLDRAHGRLSLEAVAKADALLFVSDAGQELIEPELRFLQAAAAHVETVLFALTKTESFPGWEQVVERNRERLGEAFAGAPILPVDAMLAQRAGAETDAALASELRDESGVSALEAELRARVAGRAEALRLSLLLGVAADAARQVVAADREVLAGPERDEGLAAELHDLKREREEFGRRRRRAGRELRSELRDLRSAMRSEVRRGLDDLGRRLQQEADAGRIPDLEGTLAVERRAFRAQVARGLDARLDAAAQRFAHEQDMGPELDPEARDVAARPGTPMPSGMVLSMASTVGMGARFASLATLGPPGVIAGALVGGVLGGFRIKGQRDVAAARDAQARIRDLIEVDRAELIDDIDRVVNQWDDALSDAQEEVLDERERELRRIVAEREGTAQERARQRSALQARITQLESMAARVEQLAAEARGGVGGS